MKITVAGTGYVGLVTAVCLATIGHKVICVDVDQHKVNLLNKGKSPIHEAHLEDYMTLYKHNLTYTTDYVSAYRDSDVIIIAVGTPEKLDGSADLSYVYNVVEQIACTVTKNCIVAIKSTVPIGSNDKIQTFISNNLTNDVIIEVVSNPEFLSQGTAVKDTLNANRIVLGVPSPHSEKILRQVYDGFKQPYVITDRRSAEMIKYASNDFLALKISYINEIANICEIIGADIEDVATGMGLDPRIGNKFLNAGIGYGGSCFPKDTKALHWLANFYDNELKTVKAAIEINESQKIKLVKKARKYYESFNGITVAVLGLTFKPGTDDLREAPSLASIALMLEDGAKIKAWDPVGVDNYKKIYPTQIQYCDTIEQTIIDTDICLIFTEWEDIRLFDLAKYSELMKKAIVLDGRNVYDLKEISKYSLIYDSIGRRTIYQII